MRILSILKSASISMSQFNGQVHAEVKGINPKTNEKVHLFVEVSECTDNKMIEDTIDAAVEDKLGLAYVTESTPNLAATLQKELEDYLSLPQ